MKQDNLIFTPMYYCIHCKRYFKTPNRHRCKKNPNNKSCGTCGNLNWNIPIHVLRKTVSFCNKNIDLTTHTIFDCPLWTPIN